MSRQRTENINQKNFTRILALHLDTPQRRGDGKVRPEDKVR